MIAAFEAERARARVCQGTAVARDAEGRPCGKQLSSCAGGRPVSDLEGLCPEARARIHPARAGGGTPTSTWRS